MTIDNHTVLGVHPAPEAEGNLACNEIAFCSSRDKLTGIYAVLVKSVRALFYLRVVTHGHCLGVDLCQISSGWHLTRLLGQGYEKM